MAAHLISFIHDVSVDNAKTVAFEIPHWHKYSKVFVPALGTNAAVTMEVILRRDILTGTNGTPNASLILPSADTNWKVVHDSAESNQVAASGVEDVWVDISEYTRAFPPGTHGRFVIGSAQAADSSWYVCFGD